MDGEDFEACVGFAAFVSLFCVVDAALGDCTLATAAGLVSPSLDDGGGEITVTVIVPSPQSCEEDDTSLLAAADAS